jgi:hypothetical protein
MNNSFISSVVKQLLASGTENLRSQTVVLPSHRSVLYFRKALSAAIDGPFIAPMIFVMPELVEFMSNRKIAPSHTLLLLLYECYSKVLGDKAEPFEQFVKWGSTALSDFNEIEQSLVEPRTIFQDLKNISELEAWRIEESELSPAQIQYLHFWQSLGAIYQEYHQEQWERRTCSYGRLLADVFENETWNKAGKCWFVGLHDLSAAEIKLIELIPEKELCWDVDAYYLRNQDHEAGTFFRELKNLKPENFEKSMITERKNVELVTCTSSLAEVEWLIQQIGLQPKELLDKTGIVLLKPDMLSVLLSRLPQVNSPVNVAMQLNIRLSSVHNLCELLFDIIQFQLNKKSAVVYHQHLEKLLLHPLAHGFLGGKTEHVLSQMRERVLVYLKPIELEELLGGDAFGDTIKHIVAGNTHGSVLLGHFANLMEMVFKGSKSTIDQEAAYQFNGALFQLQNLVEQNPLLNTIPATIALLKHFWASEQIRFTGEPLQGIQVLSLADTLAIDFDQIYILGCTEDSLPGNSSNRTLIPNDIREHYKLKLAQEKEAATAYMFYRLLHKAENINLVYTAQNDTFGKSEPSRYLTQIQHEWRTANGSVTITNRNFSFPQVAMPSPFDEMKNSDIARERLKVLFKRGISPSAIGKYLSCPLDFYYRYIIGIGESEEVEEHIDAATFGTIAHDVLERFFTPFKGSFPKKTDFETLKNNLEIWVDESIAKHYSAEQMSSGLNALARRVSISMLQLVIDYEIQLLEDTSLPKRTVSSIEQLLQCDLNPLENNTPVKLYGKADRIDLVGGRTRIIDYKTGKVEIKKKLLPDLNTLLLITPNVAPDKDNSKLVQLLCYSLMLYKSGTPAENIESALFSLRNYSAGYQTLKTQEGSSLTAALLEDFEKELCALFERMLNCESFAHHPESEFCEYCRS